MDKSVLFKLLADQTRYNIFLKLLDFERLCVREIEELLGLKQANTSKHLKKFKELGIVETIREGNTIYYRFTDDFMDKHEDLIRYIML